MVMFDIMNDIWIPIVQSGFIPRNEIGQSGRYNFGMAYNHLSNQIIVFGGQSNKGTFCKPHLNLFQLPDWVTTYDPILKKK